MGLANGRLMPRGICKKIGVKLLTAWGINECKEML